MVVNILCVEPDPDLLDSRCAVLTAAGYTTTSVTPRFAENVLRSQKFDLIVLPTVSDYLIGLADGAEVLILEGLTMPMQLLRLVGERLNRRRHA